MAVQPGLHDLPLLPRHQFRHARVTDAGKSELIGGSLREPQHGSDSRSLPPDSGRLQHVRQVAGLHDDPHEVHAALNAQLALQ